MLYLSAITWHPSPSATVCHLLQFAASLGMGVEVGVATVDVLPVEDVEACSEVEVGVPVEVDDEDVLPSTQICSYPSLESPFQTPVSQSEPIQGLRVVTSSMGTLKRLGNIVQLNAAIIID